MLKCRTAREIDVVGVRTVRIGARSRARTRSFRSFQNAPSLPSFTLFNRQKAERNEQKRGEAARESRAKSNYSLCFLAPLLREEQFRPSLALFSPSQLFADIRTHSAVPVQRMTDVPRRRDDLGDFSLLFRRSSASENVGKRGEGASNRKSGHQKEMGGGHAREHIQIHHAGRERHICHAATSFADGERERVVVMATITARDRYVVCTLNHQIQADNVKPPLPVRKRKSAGKTLLASF